MSTISATPRPEMQQIDLMKLNLQQLTQLKNQLDQVNERCIQYCRSAWVFVGEMP